MVDSFGYLLYLSFVVAYLVEVTFLLVVEAFSLVEEEYHLVAASSSQVEEEFRLVVVAFILLEEVGCSFLAKEEVLSFQCSQREVVHRLEEEVCSCPLGEEEVVVEY